MAGFTHMHTNSVLQFKSRTSEVLSQTIMKKVLADNVLSTKH